MSDVVYGDGSITRKADGRLQVVVSVGGRRRYAMIPARWPEKERMRRAEAKRRELLADRAADLNPSDQTVAAYLASWIDSLASAKQARIRSTTAESYATIIDLHLVPALGKHRLGRLSERHIQAWIDDNAAKPRTIRNQWAVLRRALNVAVRERRIARNPALGVELPEAADFAADVLTLDEVRALLAATEGDRLAPLWRLALATGLRQAELLALSRDALVGDELTIEHQLARRGGSWVFVPTKAARTLGTLTLDARTVEVLEAHKVRMAGERTPSWRWFGLLFVTPAGDPFQRSVIIDAFHSACRKAKIRERRFHDLRATNLTILRELGIPEDVRMARAGHSTTTMARHYARSRTGLDRGAAEAFGAAVGQQSGGNSGGSPSAQDAVEVVSGAV
jgi:integrase